MTYCTWIGVLWKLVIACISLTIDLDSLPLSRLTSAMSLPGPGAQLLLLTLVEVT